MKPFYEMSDEELEEDDLRRQAERFRPVEHAHSRQGHVLAVMSCAGREALLHRTLTSLKADDWIGPKMLMMDGRGFSARPTDWWLFHPSARLDIRAGQARTFFEVLKVASQFPNFSYLTLFEDDVVVAKNALDYIATAKYPAGVAMVSWFHRLVPLPRSEETRWMIERAADFSHAQATTLPASTVLKLLASPQLKNWIEPHGADMLLGQVMPDSDVAYHIPCIVDHVGGDLSLTGNTGERRALTFVGENFDAMTLTRPASPDTHWCRTVMYEEAKKLIAKLQPHELDVLEISGDLWRGVAFKSYTNVSYPTYDVCSTATVEKYDLIILDQVLEHVRYPQRALENVRRSLRPGGHCFVSTPFLVRVHHAPLDLWRWTEAGLRCLLEDAMFTAIETGSWGNRACAVANLDRWTVFDLRVHSLQNESDVPVTVWALAAI